MAATFFVDKNDLALGKALVKLHGPSGDAPLFVAAEEWPDAGSLPEAAFGSP